MSKKMSKKYPLLYDKTWLEQKYIKDGLCFREIAEIIGCCITGVDNALRHFNIPRRSLSDVHKGRLSEDAKRQHNERMKGNTYRLGILHSDETKKVMREKRKDMVFTDETKRKISESKKVKRTLCMVFPLGIKGREGYIQRRL